MGSERSNVFYDGRIGDISSNYPFGIAKDYLSVLVKIDTIRYLGFGRDKDE